KNLSQQTPRSIVIKYKKEQNFLVLNDALNGVTLPYTERLYDKYKALVYFQSKLIRPQGELSCLIVLKDKEFSSAPKMPLKITITDPSYREIYAKEHTTNEVGALNFTLPMLQEYKTGKYRLNVHFSGRVLARKSFSVEAFMPQKIKNKIEFKKEAYAIGELMKAKLSSKYLFGAPSSGLKAELRLNALAKNYTNKTYKNYSFNNESLRDKNKLNYFDISRQLLLDDKGEVEVALPLHVKQKVPSMLEAQMAFTVFDDGRGVSSYKRVDLYAYKHMVGVQVADTSIDKTEALEVDTLLLDPLTQKEKTSLLDVFIKRYRWHYVYDANGYYRWSKEYEDIENFRVTSGEHFSRKFESSGDYVIEVHDRLSGHSSSQNFSVRGWDYNPISPTNDMRKVQVSFEDRFYKKSEILKVSITSPILKGRLLVSLEGEKILWYKVIDIKKGSATLDIPLNFDLKDGLYLHTSVVRATDTPSTLIPFRALSSHFVKPNKDAHHSKITMKVPKLTRSNQDAILEIQSEKNATILVSVVDEGILQISQQEPPKPFEFFRRKADKKVAYYDLYDKVMHYLTQGKMLNFGGDSASELKKAQKHKAPDTGAKRVKPFLFWSGLIQTDSSGYTKVKIPVPAFNGQAKIVVVSLGKESIGALSTDLIVRDDIIIKPTYPRFSLIGDTLNIPVRIFNTTADEINASLRAQSSEQLSVKGLAQTISLAAKSSQLYKMQVHAKAFGKGEIKITASDVNSSYFDKVELPVVYAYPLQTHVLRGELNSSKEFKIPEKYLSKDTPAEITMSVSNNFLSQLKGSVNYLVDYPYGCAEQTSSKLFAMLYLEDFLEGDSSDESKNLLRDRDYFIKAGIEKLANIQGHGGEFSYWNRGGYVNPYASIYASDMLLHVKEFGYSVPDALLRNTFNALQSMAQGRGKYKYGNISNFERMYASYLLSKSKKLDISLVNTLYDKNLYKQNLLSHYMMAVILKNARMNKEMIQILTTIESYDLSKISDIRTLGHDFYSRLRNLSFALYLHVENFKKNYVSQALLEATQKAATSLYSTQEKAMLMRALATYYKGETDNAMDVTLDINNKKESYKESFNLERELDKATIILDSKRLINYNIEVSQYLPREVKHDDILGNTKALNIRRSYVNEKGQTVDLKDITLGDLIYSKVEVQSPQKLENIVISDRIPSCFEIINERVQAHKRIQEVKNSASFRADYQDIRDDRILTFLSLGGDAMTYFTPLRVTTAGECKLPAIVGEAMYDSRVSDYDKEVERIYVKRDRLSSQKIKVDKLNQKW
ncbi:MAG: alpha-2-macroglobulin family protein, partial [Campylobacterota bacterium]|nr:alpha-2-macroglobulin family protein [Campylobacterota bacterium]